MKSKNPRKDLKKILNFLHQAERLKMLMRHSWLSNGRRESVAEHTWRLALMAVLLAPYLRKKVNLEKVLKMALVHDLAEAYAGDHFAWKGPLKNKYKIEKKGLAKILKSLPKKQSLEINSLWEEHEAWLTEESKFVRALDKTEAIIQHNEANIKTWLKVERDLNLVYGLKHTQHDPALKIFRDLIKQETLVKMKKEKK